MRSFKTIAVGVGACAVAFAAMSSTVAVADPPSLPHSYDIVGVGSDTTEDVLNSLSTHYDADLAPADKLYSWNATGSAMITPKYHAQTITRPDGSGAGISALETYPQTTIDFARSSSGPAATDPSSITYVAMATDAVTVATDTTTDAPLNFSTADLTKIYSCSIRKWYQVSGNSTGSHKLIVPFLPQASSGTRKFFLKAIGVTTPGSCVQQGVQENEGTDPSLNNPDAIVPYAISKYIAQTNGFSHDDRGVLKLNSINGHAPTKGSGKDEVINAGFSSVFLRTVYNVVRTDTSQLDNVPAYLEPIFGASGYICTSSHAATSLKSYGFLSLGSHCGVTTTPGG